MKRLFCLLLLLVVLIGCTGQETPVPAPEPEAPPVQAEVPPPAEPEPEPEPEPTVPVIPTVPPQPVYRFTSDDMTRIIADDGSIVLESQNQLYILRDQFSGSVAGIVEQCAEGWVYDEYGWAMPERQWCVLYDLQGQTLMTLPLEHVSLCNGRLFGYNSASRSSAIYNLSDDIPLLQNLHGLYPMEGHLIFQQDHNEAPDTILSPDGGILQLPPGIRLSRILTDTDGTVYLSVRRSQLVGLMDLQGNLLVDYHYQDIPAIQDGIAYLANTFSTDCYSLQDQTILQTWPVQALSIYPTCAIALQGNNWEQQVLVDLNGQLLCDQVFSYISVLDPEQDGQPELFQGTRYRQEGQSTVTLTTLLRPDGTVLDDRMPNDGSLQPLNSQFAIHTLRVWDPVLERSTGTVTLMDLQTGQQIAVWEGENLNAHPLYYTGYEVQDTISRSCFLLNQQNPLGWGRISLLAPDGTVLLEQLSSAAYLGGGVLQVQQGFTTGLIRLDGTWLYQESRFSTVED